LTNSLRDKTNKRTDQYGDGFENRCRFLLQVVDAVSAVAGPERTGVRISPQNTQNDIEDSDPQALFDFVAKQLSGRGLAYLHIIEGDTSGVSVEPFNYRRLKELFGGVSSPIMLSIRLGRTAPSPKGALTSSPSANPSSEIPIW
jgi:N-ethylmaleimide reductase